MKPFFKGHKYNYRDADAIAEAVQRPTNPAYLHFALAGWGSSGGADTDLLSAI